MADGLTVKEVSVQEQPPSGESTKFSLATGETGNLTRLLFASVKKKGYLWFISNSFR